VKRERTIDVELNRTRFDDDQADIYVSWHAEWGIRDDGAVAGATFRRHRFDGASR
jgi:hypothetical protein